jgi:hypothetical protein
MKKSEIKDVETDPRFPSGKWLGFWKQGALRGDMECVLQFSKGALTGEGRDRIGKFTFRGRYSAEDGKCHWVKHYAHAHDVFYNGYNEGKGIWGIWELTAGSLTLDRGGFHIWPEGMNVGPQAHVAAEADVDEVIEGTLEVSDPIIVRAP